MPNSQEAVGDAFSVDGASVKDIRLLTNMTSEEFIISPSPTFITGTDLQFMVLFKPFYLLKFLLPCTLTFNII